jgi:hypothetical protein
MSHLQCYTYRPLSELADNPANLPAGSEAILPLQEPRVAVAAFTKFAFYTGVVRWTQQLPITTKSYVNSR